MRSLGTEGWAGAVMLVVAVAVSLPALLGLADPAIPRALWALLLVAHLAGLLGVAVAQRPRRGGAALAGAVVSAWLLVLTAPGMGLLNILVVMTAAISVYTVSLRVTMAIIALNSGVILLALQLSTADLFETLMVGGFYLLIQLASAFSTATLLREKRMRTELAQAHVELKAAGILLAESTRTAERLRISRELHDLIGHQLTVLTLNLEAARHLDAEQGRPHIERADEVARGLLRDVRATVGEMRSRPADLRRSLEEMVEGIPGLAVEVATDPELDLRDEHQIAFLRLAQEAVTNTIRHSGASRLTIEVSREDDQIMLVARDDGIGARSAELGNGLRGLRERFESLGGDLTVDGVRGFAVTGRVAVT
ncbi:MAG TPA: histidine kinase [Brachybacterium sp.]|nr:histidine kinase [Brachybacterium sp.]